MRVLAVAGLAAALAIAWRLGQRPPSDEEVIAAMLESMRAGAEAKDPSPILEHVAEGFRDERGMGRRELRGYLLGYFLGAQSISATFLSRRIEVNGRAATVQLRVLLRRDGAGDPRRISLRLGKTSGEWKIESSRDESMLGGP